MNINAPSGFPCTLVSIVPFPIVEEKPGMIPNHFEVKASLDGEPQCTIVGDALHFVYINGDRGSFRVTSPSHVIAKSIVDDYLSAQLAAGPDAHPGFFWVPGELGPTEIKRYKTEELQEQQVYQRNWFMELIKMADDNWERSRSHHTISDTQRFAVKTLNPENKKNRPWVFQLSMLDETPVTTMLCPACGSDIPANVVICKYCQNILDPVRYAQMNFANMAQRAIQRTQ